MLTANNTWQGISFGNWPYSENPPTIYGNLKENMIEITDIKHVVAVQGPNSNCTIDQSPAPIRINSISSFGKGFPPAS